jgi:hypothetical protein
VQVFALDVGSRHPINILESALAKARTLELRRSAG